MVEPSAMRDGPAVDGAIEAPSPNETDVSFHPLALYYLEDDDDDDDDEEEDDGMPANFTMSDKLRRIAPVYCAAKEVLLSSSLKAHIEGSTDLRRTLERRVLNILALNLLCENFEDPKALVLVLDLGPLVTWRNGYERTTISDLTLPRWWLRLSHAPFRTCTNAASPIATSSRRTFSSSGHRQRWAHPFSVRTNLGRLWMRVRWEFYSHDARWDTRVYSPRTPSKVPTHLRCR
jgi:hypothetical protein